MAGEPRTARCQDHALETAWRLAEAWHGHKLDPDWRRHTLEEAEALFIQLGLVGEFWRLRA